MSIPDWFLILAYWLHMLATVAWIGSLAALSLIVIPSARAALSSDQYADFMTKQQKRLEPVAWFSLFILLATGMFQMSANSNYGGILTITNRWSVAMLVKHILFLFVTALSVYMTWFLIPGLRRAVLVDTHHNDKQTTGIQSKTLLQREAFIVRLNLILGVIILALTAIARAS